MPGLLKGRQRGECDDEGMNGVNSLVSGWGGGHPKHCDHTQSPTPRPTDREALSLLPWTEATENVRDVLPQLQTTNLASLPPGTLATLEGQKAAPPRVALLESALADSTLPGDDSVTLTAKNSSHPTTWIGTCSVETNCV